MKYFKNPENEVYGYDDTQQDLIDQAVANGWVDVTGSWPPSPVQPEITQVSMRQCRLALLQENQLVSVEALINTPEQKIWWDYSTIVEKDNQLVKDMAVALDWTPEYLTSLFELANTL